MRRRLYGDTGSGAIRLYGCHGTSNAAANLLSYPDFASKETRVVTPGSWNPERKEPDPGARAWRLKERRGAWTWIAFVFIVVAIVSFIMRAALM